MNIYQVYKNTIDILSKNNSQTISFEEFTRYANMAQNELFDDLRGANNQPRTAYGKSRKLDERLNPFRSQDTLTFSNGSAPKENNVKQILTLTYNNDVVHPIDEDREGIINKDPLAEDMYYAERLEYLEIVKGVKNLTAKIKFLRLPEKVDLRYELINNRPVYDSTTSVDFEWGDNMEWEIITRILKFAGISNANQLVLQQAQISKAEE